MVFLNNNGGRLLYNEAGWVLPGENGDVTKRNNNYIFTGEQIQWTVLVWDKNGVPEKVNDVFAGWIAQTNGPLDPEIQVNCQYLGSIESGSLAEQGYSNVRRPTDQEAQVNGNPETMGEYVCLMTIEPTCHGQKWFGVKAVDLDNNTGTMQEAESWFCNPSLDLTISGAINYGDMSPGTQKAATVSIKNSAETGSGTEVVLAISGKDFYDPSSSGAMCPTSNFLKLQGVNQSDFATGFWYTAKQGTLSTGNKRIPYTTNAEIASADPLFSSSSSSNSWRKWSANELKPMSPGSEATLTLHLGLPQPCNGQFTDGDITLWAWAI